MLNLNKKLSVSERLQKDVTDILSVDIYVPLAGIISLGISEIVDEPLPFTACTNGRDVIYGEHFVGGLSDAEFRFIILHENYHKLDRHLHHYIHLYNIDPKLAGIACDIWINLTLIAENEWIMYNVPQASFKWPDGFAVMPEGGYADDQYKDWDISRIFWDIHQRQEDGEDIYPPEQGYSPLDEHDHEGAQELDAKEQEDLAREIEGAIRQGAITAGKLGLQTSRTIEGILNPKVPWQKVCKDWVRQMCAGKDYSTWAKPNRRHLGQGVYMPTSLSQKMEHLVLAPDMSYSCHDYLGQWLGEFKKVAETLRPTTLHLIWWDTEVAGHESFTQDQLENIDLVMRNIQPMGGGGTSVLCVPKYLQENRITPTACAVLTDGELFGGWGNWECPVLWCIAGNPDARPTIGKAVHIEV